jgi:hypothetical protein
MSYQSEAAPKDKKRPMEEGSKEDSEAQERQQTSGNPSSWIGLGERTPFVGQPSAHMQKQHWDRKTSKMLGEPEE